MTNSRAVVLLSQMYFPWLDSEEWDALSWAIQKLQEKDMELKVIKYNQSENIKKYYSDPPCSDCDNDICKVYGGRCNNYYKKKRRNKDVRKVP